MLVTIQTILLGTSIFQRQMEANDEYHLKNVLSENTFTRRNSKQNVQRLSNIFRSYFSYQRQPLKV